MCFFTHRFAGGFGARDYRQTAAGGNAGGFGGRGRNQGGHGGARGFGGGENLYSLVFQLRMSHFCLVRTYISGVSGIVCTYTHCPAKRKTTPNLIGLAAMF